VVASVIAFMASTFARLLSRAASSAGVLDFFSTPDGFFVALDEGDGERDDPDEEEDDEEEDDDEEESESELEELEELDDSSFLERFLAIAFRRVLRHLVPKEELVCTHKRKGRSRAREDCAYARTSPGRMRPCCRFQCSSQRQLLLVTS